jgi:hypothetical protein
MRPPCRPNGQHSEFSARTRIHRLGLAFGTGSGLTLDEIAVLTERDNPYWESERLALAQAAVAALGAAGLMGRFLGKGRPKQD